MEGALRTRKCLKSLELPQFKGPWWRQVSYIFKAHPCRHSLHGNHIKYCSAGKIVSMHWVSLKIRNSKEIRE